MGTGDRVRDNSSPHINSRLDALAEERVRALEGRPRTEIERRVDELEHEWDMERFLETNAALIAGAGVALASLFSKKFLVIPGIVLPFLFQHATQGWCPPVPVFRRMGVRTRREIEAEKRAVEALLNA